MKVALVVDHFQGKGGAERLEMTLAEKLPADIFTGYVLNASFNLAHLEVKTIFRRMNSRFIRYFFQRRAFKAIAPDLAKYDTVIYFGNSLDSAPLLPKSTKKILYCHTPPRHIYSDKEYYTAQFPWFIRPFYRFYTWLYKRHYESLLKHMDVIVTNSRNVQERLKKYTGFESTVVYPPCNTERFIWTGQKDYYLSFSRLEEVKRVDLIAKAFTQIPDQKLVIVSGGPELKNIQQIAAQSPNIQVKGWVSEEELLDLIGNCIATIYVSLDEDFGMGAVESLSAGKAIIASNEGGFKEIVTASTGILLSETTPESIAKAVQALTPEKAQAMREMCIKQAKKFSEENFIADMKKVIQSL